jgi:heme/copper-type cytochrome/quinol oxidase subunit 3
MSTFATIAPRAPLALDDRRGSMGMMLFILSEGFLFLALFFSYYYLGADAPQWPPELPTLHFALPMLGVLVASSVVLYWGEERVKAGAVKAAKLAMVVTVALGVVFLVLQYFEYSEHLRTLTPRSNAYGSIFYTITSVHAVHLMLGLLMLVYVLALPLAPVRKPPHRPMHNAALYWHFVDLVWVFIVSLLYVFPHFVR